MQLFTPMGSAPKPMCPTLNLRNTVVMTNHDVSLCNFLTARFSKAHIKFFVLKHAAERVWNQTVSQLFYLCMK